MLDEQEGEQYYRSLMEAFRSKSGSSIIADLYHHDLPQILQDDGGWANDQIVGDFVDYARTCFKKFGDLVGHWITIASPLDEVIYYLTTSFYNHR